MIRVFKALGILALLLIVPFAAVGFALGIYISANLFFDMFTAVFSWLVDMISGGINVD